MKKRKEMLAEEPSVIYEDAHILVVDKPAGLAVHADGKHERATLVDWLVEKYPDLVGVGEPQTLANGTVIDRPGIVHRIDRETSGVLVVARTQEAFEMLKSQFQNREIQKIYRAFVFGAFREERGIIDKPIGSARGGIGPRSASRPHGTVRDAVTMYRVIASGAGASYVEVFPKTGRTHQIRVHFSSVQHPLLSDQLYAPGRPQLLGFTRLALHALSLTLTHPNGKLMTFSAPLPPDFVAAEKELRKG